MSAMLEMVDVPRNASTNLDPSNVNVVLGTNFQVTRSRAQVILFSFNIVLLFEEYKLYGAINIDTNIILMNMNFDTL